MTDHDTEPVLLAWRAWMRAQGLADKTVGERVRVVGLLASEVPDITSCDVETLMKYLDRPLAPATRHTYLGHLQAFYRFLVISGRRADDPTARLRPKRVPRGEPHPVSTQQLRALLGSRMHRRTRTMILLAAYQGLRVSELARVRGEDVDLIGGTLRVLGKGGVSAVLPLHPLVAQEAVTYPRVGWWFPTYHGNRQGTVGPMLGNSVSSILAEAMARAGISLSAHSLRHWFGTELVRGGADLRTAQTLLRHASLQTTQIYVGVSDNRRAAAVASLPAPVEGLDGLDMLTA